MSTRCPSTEPVAIEGNDLELQCTIWSDDPEARHPGNHQALVPANMGGIHTWPNENSLPEDD